MSATRAAYLWSRFRAIALGRISTACVLTFLAAVVALASPSSASAVGWVTWQVTHNDTSEGPPLICGNWITFERDSEIYIRNLVTGEEMRLTSNTLQEEWPDISRRYVVWDRWDGQQWTVMAWDCATGLTFPTALHGLYPSVSGSRVVCEQIDMIQGSYFAQVAAQTLPGGGALYLTWDMNQNQHPRIGRDLVVWSGLMSPGYFTAEIFKADLALGGGPVRLTDDSSNDTSPDTDGLVIVWTQCPATSEDAEIWGHTPVLGLTAALTNNSVYDGFPAVSFPRITYVSYAAGNTTVQVQVLDLWTFTTTTLGTTRILYESQKAEIDGPRVVWIDHDGHDFEIWAAAYCSFDDVPHTHPNYFAIQSLADLLIISGYGGNRFGPDDLVRRAQYAKMVVGALNIPVSEASWLDTAPPFQDLGPDNPLDLYPHDYVAAAAANKITLGTTPTKFDPWSNVTRAQVVTMALRGASLWWKVPLPAVPAGWVGHLTFTDPTHGGYMRQADYLGILDGIVGLGPGWNPWAPATRAEVAQILWATRDVLMP